MATTVQVLTKANRLTFRLTLPAPKIEGIAFSGGGPKGIAYGGAIEALENSKVMEQISRVAGASAGAMTAMMVAIGMSSKDIKTVLKETDITKLIDVDLNPGIKSLIKYAIKGRDSGEKLYQFMNSMVAKQVEILLADVDKRKIKNPKYNEIHIKLIAKLGREEPITFRDLHDLRSLLPSDKKHKIKALYMVGTNKTQKTLEEYSYETKPDMPIALAAQISGAHPIMFKPYINEKGEKIADGGILDNMPVSQLEKHSPTAMAGRHRNNTNLCFILGDTKTHKYNREILLGSAKSLTSTFKKKLTKLMDSAIATAPLGGNILASDQKFEATVRELSSRVIPLPTLEIGTYTLAASNEQKQAVIDASKQATGDYLVQHGMASVRRNGGQETYLPSQEGEIVLYDYNNALEMALSIDKVTLEYLKANPEKIECLAPQRDKILAALSFATRIGELEGIIKQKFRNDEVNPQEIIDITQEIATQVNNNVSIMRTIQDRLDIITGGKYMNVITGEDFINVNPETSGVNFQLLEEKITLCIEQLMEYIAEQTNSKGATKANNNIAIAEAIIAEFEHITNPLSGHKPMSKDLQIVIDQKAQEKSKDCVSTMAKNLLRTKDILANFIGSKEELGIPAVKMK